MLNDVVLFYDKSKNKIQMVVGSMAIQMRDLVVEGAKKALLPEIDVTKHEDNTIYDGMKKIVSTYQSEFL